MKRQSTPIRHRHQHSHSEHQIPTKEKLFPLYRSVTEDDQHNYHTHSSPITRFVRKLLGLGGPSRPRQHHKTQSTTSITKSSVISSIQPNKTNDSCLDEPKKQTTIKIVTPDVSGILASSVIDWDRDSLPNSCSIKGDDESTDVCSITSNDSTASGLSTENSSITDGLLPIDKASSAAVNALMSAIMLPTKKNLTRDEFDELPKVNLLGRESITTSLMTESMATIIRPYIPRRFRIVQNWDLLYSLDQHGASLATLYSCTENFVGPCILIIQDLDEQIFGAYLSHSFQLQTHYYGTGECFLWKSTSQHETKATIPKIKVFPWTGKNDYMILSNPNFVAIGGGDGKFGLWLDSELHDGHSDQCPTFDNEALHFNSRFQCMKVEVWGLCL